MSIKIPTFRVRILFVQRIPSILESVRAKEDLFSKDKYQKGSVNKQNRTNDAGKFSSAKAGRVYSDC